MQRRMQERLGVILWGASIGRGLPSGSAVCDETGLEFNDIREAVWFTRGSIDGGLGRSGLVRCV